MKNWRLERWSLLGDGFTLLCCVGFGPLLSALSAIGAGFLINDLILAPLLMLFLILGGAGLWHARRSHGRAAPLRIHIASSLVLLIFTFVAFVPVLIGLGMVGLLGAVGVDIWAARTAKKQCA